MARKDANPGQHEAAADRRIKALDLRIAGEGYRAIGAALGISTSQAYRDVQAALKRLAAMETAGAEEYRALELARLDTLTVEAARVLSATHPLVSGGKVLSGFTTDGEPIGLTDDGPKLAAIDRLLRISESRRKLMGLDAPAKTALTNPDGTAPMHAYAELRAVVLNLLPMEQRLLLADQLAQLPDESDDGELADN